MTTAKRLAIILGWLMLSITALTQTTNNGNVVSVGQVNNGGGGGAPLTYNARTDFCVTGSETGCSGLGLNFQMRLTDTAPFANLAPANSTAIDPDFHSFLLMVTDTSTASGSPTKVFNMSELNNSDMFSQDSSMLIVASNQQLFSLNKAAIAVAEGGGTSCLVSQCVAKSAIVQGNIGAGCSTNCTILDNKGNVSFSRVPGENNVLYELAGNGYQVNRLVINATGPPSGWTFSRTLYVDFSSDTPVPCSVVPAGYTAGWTGGFTVANDGSFTVDASGGPPWTAGKSYAAPDSFIWPVNNNSAKNGFQATVSGTSGASEPNWSVSCPNVGNTCVDGGATWTNIDRLGSQGSGFDVLTFGSASGDHKGCSRLNTYIGKVYRGTNEGPSWPAAGSPDPSGAWTTDTDSICEPYGTNPCPLNSDYAQIHDGGSKMDSRYSSFTPTGGSGPPANCLVPGACSCSAVNSNYIPGGYNPATQYLTNDTIYNAALGPPYTLYKAGSNVIGVGPPNSPWTVASSPCQHIMWSMNSTVQHVCIDRGTLNGSTSRGNCTGHSIQGYLYLASNGFYRHSWSSPTIQGVANPGTLFSDPTIGDSHSSYRNSGTLDNTPAGIAHDDVPTTTYAVIDSQNPGLAAGYGEFTGLAFDGSGKNYRFAHNYNTGSEANFASQHNISVISSDGRWTLIPTDMMGTRGSDSPAWIPTQTYTWGDYMFPVNGNAGAYDYQVTAIGGNSSPAPGTTGTSGSVEPNWDSGCATSCTDGVGAAQLTWTRQPTSCNQLRALYAPATGTAFNLNDMVSPVGNNSSYDIFKATQAGTTYSSLPNWHSLMPYWGSTVCDDAVHEQNQACSFGIVQWTNIGSNDCRSDIMLVDLVSAH